MSGWTMPHDADLLTRLHRSLAALQIQGQQVLVAVSGGPDSVALCRGLLHFRDEFELRVTVAHYNHRARGEASQADAVWVAEQAHLWDCAVILGTSPAVPERLQEETARQARYEFLRQTAAAVGASLLLTGHTRDDRVETVLHHLLRGTGPAGMQGIPREREWQGLRLFRPLLDCSRADVLAYLSSCGQAFREDATNIDVQWTRNWLRQEILPTIRQRFPHADAAIARLADQVSELVYLQAELGRAALAACRSAAAPTVLNVSDLREQPVAVIREAFVQLWIEQGWPRQEMGFDRWQELADLVAAPRGAISLPGGIEARRSRGQLVLQRR